MRIVYIIFTFILLNSYAFSLPGDKLKRRIPNTMGDTGRFEFNDPGRDKNTTIDGWGWAYRKCNCSKSDNPCCTAECRHRYCIKKNKISDTVFPPECAPTVAALNACEKEYGLASLAYKRSKDKEDADGGEKGNIVVKKNSKAISSQKDEPIKIYEVKIKQGAFIGNDSKAITFKMNDAIGKEISFRYKVYDCTDDSIKNKKFDTFTLSEISTVNSSGIARKQVLRTMQVPFICRIPYYTVTAIKRETTTLEPTESYRGIGSTLKNYEEDKDIYYIHIDADKGKIEQLHVDSKSTRKIHREAYVLNTKKCKYEIKVKDKLVKNLGGSPILKSEDEGWGFDDNTTFYVDLEPEHKPLTFTWGRLKKDGYYSKSLTYKKKMPQLAKDILDKVNNMATKYRNIAKNSEEIKIWKAVIEQSASSQDTKCGGKVSFESLLIPPVDNTQDPKVEFKINIRQSTKKEIKIFKSRMKYIKGQ